MALVGHSFSLVVHVIPVVVAPVNFAVLHSEFADLLGMGEDKNNIEQSSTPSNPSDAIGETVIVFFSSYIVVYGQMDGLLCVWAHRVGNNQCEVAVNCSRRL